MLDLGLSYYSGAGVQQRDPRTAFRWLSRAADFGYPEAQDVIGEMYEDGDGVGQSDEQAVAWYRKSAAQGDPLGMTSLGRLLAQAGNGPEAGELFQKAAAMGFAEAESDLAFAYLIGVDGLPKDHGEAAYWYGKAAEHGVTYARIGLGELLESGDGVERDPARARQLYQQAADQNPGPSDDMARQHLARMDSAQRSAPRLIPPPNAKPAPSDKPSGYFGDLISPGVIAPLPGYEPQPSEDGVPQRPVISRQDTPPEPPPPHRPLPTRPSASSDNGEALFWLGAIFIGGAWLLSHSCSNSKTTNPDAVRFPPLPPPKSPFEGTDLWGGTCSPKGFLCQ